MTVPAGVDPDLESMMRKVFAESVTTNERSAEVNLDRDLWATLENVGLTSLVSGEGGTWTDAVALLRAAAAHHAPVPLAEHDLLAQWLRECAQLSPSPDPSIACLVEGPDDVVRAAWASQVDRVVVLSSQEGVARVTDLDASSLRMEEGRDLAGVPRDQVQIPFELLDGPRVDEALHVNEFRLRGVLARCAQMTGAMVAAVDMSREYALQRHQFGRPIAQFQAVQHLFVEAAAECALAGAAVDAAGACVDQQSFGTKDAWEAIAVAKSVSARAATVVSRNTHQIHGAVGTTLELPLHRLTRPLLVWRSEFGGSRTWEAALGAHLIASTEPAWFHAAR